MSAGGIAAVRDWLGARYVLLAVAASLLVALVLAIPTAIIANPYFTRMTPVEPEQYVFWILTSLLTGALLATYLEPGLRQGLAGRSAGAGVLGVLAVGCPICNKLVVALLGTSGALSYFAPVQPLLGVAAAGLAGYGLWVRMRALATRSCPLPGAGSSAIP
jgi:hypothetical protein